jgi:hypothetical protein
MLSSLLPIHLWSPTGFESTPWPKARDCPRFTISANYILRPRFPGFMAALCRLRRQDFTGGSRGRPASPAANQVRSDHQSQDRQGARHRNLALAARPRRRGDRVAACFAAVPNDAIGPKQTSHGALVVLASAKSQTDALEPYTLELRCPRLTCFHRQCARQRPARHDFTSRKRESVWIAR